MVTLLLLACAGDPGKEDTATADTGDSGEDTAVDSGVETGDTGEETGDSGEETGDPGADADGDGFVAAADGGDDCDDGSAWVHPGATEYCDAVDQDCDGDALAGASCSVAQEPEAGIWWAFELAGGGGADFGMVNDVTGDTVPDFVFGGDPDHEYSIFAGGRSDGRFAIPDDAWMVIDIEGGIMGREILDVGDVNGDGERDLGFVQHYAAHGVYLHFGPFSEGESRGAYGDADAIWWGYPQNVDQWAYPIVAGADFDGDGLDDAVAGNGIEDLYADDVAVDVYFGGDWDTRCDLHAFAGSGFSHLIGDADADGLADLQVYANATSWLISGADLRAACGAELSDVAYAWSTPGDEGLDHAGGWANAGDWSGDGLDELIVGAGLSDSVCDSCGEILFLPADITGAFGSEAALGSYVGGGEGHRLGYELNLADIDGDGVSDIVTGEGSPNDKVILRGGSIPPLRSDLPERHIRLAAGLRMPDVPPGDLDADGFADVFAVYNEEAEPILIGVWPGFAIPWDDPSYW